MNTDQLFIENFIAHHPVDAARILERQKIDEVVLFLKQLPHHLALSIIHNLDSFIAVKCLELLESEHSVPIIEQLPSKLISAYLRLIKQEHREKILNSMKKESI